MMTALLGGLSASLFKDLNPFVAASQLTDSSLLLLVITACAMVSMISIKLSNAYTGDTVCLTHFLPYRGFKVR
jgi:hypothetical protein